MIELTVSFLSVSIALTSVPSLKGSRNLWFQPCKTNSLVIIQIVMLRSAVGPSDLWFLWIGHQICELIWGRLYRNLLKRRIPQVTRNPDHLRRWIIFTALVRGNLATQTRDDSIAEFRKCTISEYTRLMPALEESDTSHGGTWSILSHFGSPLGDSLSMTTAPYR